MQNNKNNGDKGAGIQQTSQILRACEGLDMLPLALMRNDERQMLRSEAGTGPH